MVILCGLRKSHCLHPHMVLRTWRMLDWMIQKKNCHSPFNSSLMGVFFYLWNQTSVHSSSGVSTFLIDPCWIQASYGWFNSHISGCDNVTLGLWHTWINKAAAWQISNVTGEIRELSGNTGFHPLMLGYELHYCLGCEYNTQMRYRGNTVVSVRTMSVSGDPKYTTSPTPPSPCGSSLW